MIYTAVSELPHDWVDSCFYDIHTDRHFYRPVCGTMCFLANEKRCRPALFYHRPWALTQLVMPMSNTPFTRSCRHRANVEQTLSWLVQLTY